MYLPNGCSDFLQIDGKVPQGDLVCLADPEPKVEGQRSRNMELTSNQNMRLPGEMRSRSHD